MLAIRYVAADAGNTPIFFQRQFGYKSGQLPNSHAAFKRTITLPLYPQMSENDLDLIADTFKVVVALQAN